MKIEITDPAKWYRSFTVKLALLAVLGLLLLIPLQMIKEIIKERQSNADEVRKEISEQWAAKQCFSGPVLNIPARTIPTEKDEKPVIQIWHILPENLEITGNLFPEIRYRSIYKSVVYNSELKISGYFVIPAAEIVKEYEILWEGAYYTAGISDNRGLKGDINMTIDTVTLSAEPGVKDRDLFESGVSFTSPVRNAGQKIDFKMDINLAGSEGLELTPLGKITVTHLKSDWPSPGFTGSFLPVVRTVDKTGFSADWEVTHLNRNYPQNWVGKAFQPMESAFGLDLVQPVDHYQKSWRSARYGILIIALTFLVLVFLEIRRKETIPVFHYLLVSLGLVLFFSLLNALGEQIGFNAAYLIASVATISLISWFTGSILKDKKTAWIVLGLLMLLYIFIFVLLTLNDYAYLAGNIGLFVILAVIMFQSVKWTAIRK